ncbi:JAB domain-containing protein [Sunxiuqinia sp. A32]|uniref:JAB domain-containing protein n=1 Tax=Sunxiuqinia sp. A32 TaxID=3461496 RepID=UPI0040453F54
MKHNPFQIAEITVSYQPKIRPSERVKITSSGEAEKVFRQIWEYPLELKECFYALFLNRANKVLGYLLVSVGGISGTVIDIRTIFQTALKVNASSLVLAHNHPSGNPKPSDADLKITEKAKEAGKFMEIQVLDHLIMLSEGYLSFADEGMI